MSLVFAIDPALVSDLSNAPVTDDTEFLTRTRTPEQPSLWPTEELIVPQSLREMRKSVAAVHATALDASPGLNARRLFDACILIAQIDCRKRPGLIDKIRNERVSPLFETRVTELAQLAGIPGKNFQRVYDELNQLYDMSLAWNIVGEDAEVEWSMKSHFLSLLGIGQGGKKGTVRFALDPAILVIVLEPTKWANLSLQAMRGLPTAASYALYQNTFRYIGTHNKVTAALPTATWIELLLGNSRYVVNDPKGGKVVVDYGDFKRRKLLDAMERVNEMPALNYSLELKEFKSGNRVSKLQFKFVPKKQQTLELPVTWHPDLQQVLASIGFTEAQVSDLAQSYSSEEVTETVLRLKAAEDRLREGGRSITSRTAYFMGILANVATGASVDETNVALIEAEARAQEAVRADQARRERRQEEFSKHQRDVFASALFDMPEAGRQEVIEAFENSNAGQNAKLLLQRGWNPANVGAVTLLKAWIAQQRPELMSQLLRNPEDKDFDAWLAWRLDQHEATR